MAAPDLERLLAELLEPDSDVIRRIRQLAAVLLRRRLLGRWKRLDPALRQRLPTLLAEALERETEHTVTVVLAQLGALVLRRGGLSAWGPLGTWVQEVARDPRPPHQEAALLVLSAALEAAPQVLAPHGPALAALCRGALAPGVPPSPPAYSLQALGGLGAMLGDTHTELLRSLLPDILTALKKLLDADEERGTEALEVLDEFLEADPATVTPHLRPLLDLCLQVAGDECWGDAVRVRALATVTFLAQKRPKVRRGALGYTGGHWEGTGMYWGALGYTGGHWEGTGGHWDILGGLGGHCGGHWDVLGDTGSDWGGHWGGTGIFWGHWGALGGY
ncbi:importin-4 [Grus japonensis]|uniref:Importin-4 n=1 Tax=Grus japonensis TaxID=30415 RepID=A0ABC9YCH1_GRUJA